jgi:hypothetical protein
VRDREACQIGIGIDEAAKLRELFDAIPFDEGADVMIGAIARADRR